MIPGLRRWLRVPRSSSEQARRDVDDEVKFHLEMRAQELVQLGLSPEAARVQAELEFGDLESGRARLRREATMREREERRARYLDELRQDLRYSLRALRKTRGFSLVTIVTLALGIALTTTVFTVFNALLLRPLPVAAPDRVVVPQSYNRQSLESGWNVTYADYLDWRERAVFEAVGVVQMTESDIRLATEPERLQVALVTDQFFAALGARTAAGRLLGPADFRPGAPRAIVISYDIWQSRFAGDSAVVGRAIGAQRATTIVGVLARGAAYPRTAQAWFPLLTPQGTPSDWLQRDNYIFGSIARLRSDATVESTRARLDVMAREIERQIPSERANVSVRPVPLLDYMLGNNLPRALWVLLLAVISVLLIGCANIANLLLVRGSGRRREFALRLAMGARPLRLARQLLTESMVLGAIGGLTGLLLARWGVQLLLHMAPADLPRLSEVRLHPMVLLVGFAASLLAAALFGLVPMFQAMRVAAGETLADASARSAGGRQSGRLRRTLVVAELALSVMLLVGSGLLVRSLYHLLRVDTGVSLNNVTTISLRAPQRFTTAEAVATFFAQAVERVRGLPGVQSATLSSALPLNGGGFYLGRAFLAEGWPQPPNGPEGQGYWNVVGPQHFATLGIAMERGRDFNDQDQANSVPVIIVNRRFAERMFPGENPIGKRVRSWRDENLLREIVGVVNDVRYFTISDRPPALVYVPHTQNSWSVMSVLIRSQRPAADLIPLLRREIAALAPNVAVANISSMEQAYSAAVATPRFNTMLLSVFAGLALLLAALGIYGVLAYGVSQRTREIGVRMALGASRRNVISLVLSEAGLLVAIGVGLGLVGAFAAAQLMRGLLFELQPRDPLTFGIVAGTLTLVALVASYLPARRATRVAPNVALRMD